jgi:NitT/TauT family transport system substrate-binding protein
LLADARTPERSIEVFGASLSTAALVAQERWLQANPDTARRLVRAVKKAMQWMREQSAERIRAEIAEDDRMPDADADLDAIWYAQRAMSRDGILPSDAPETVQKILALSNEKVRTAQIDLSRTHTNEFAAAR